VQRTASVILIVAAAAVGAIASMTTLVVTEFWSYVAFGVCGLLALAGILLALWPRKTPDVSPGISVTMGDGNKVGRIGNDHHGR
jgi:hypothetical protein